MKKMRLKNPFARRKLNMSQPGYCDQDDDSLTQTVQETRVNNNLTSNNNIMAKRNLNTEQILELLKSNSQNSQDSIGENVFGTTLQEVKDNTNFRGGDLKNIKPGAFKDDCSWNLMPDKKTMDDENASTSRECSNKENIMPSKNTYNMRENRAFKNYNECDNNNEDFSPDSSEYIPSPYREIRSDTPSVTSIGGDSTLIDGLIDSSNMRSPSIISDLSFVLDNVDFVATPSAIYKMSNKRNNKITLHEDRNALRVQDPFRDPQQQYRNSSPINQNDVTLTSDDRHTRVSYSVLDDVDKTINACINDLDETVSLPSSSNYTNEINANRHVDSNDKEQLDGTEIINNDLNKYNRNNQVQSNATEALESSSLSSSCMIHDSNYIQTETESEVIQQNDLSTLENQRKPSRKRKICENEWKDHKNKQLKNSGEAYEGCRSKKCFSGKTVGSVCWCNKKCSEKFTCEQRENIHNSFYRLQSHELQWQYIARHVSSNPVKRITLERKNNRTQTFKYSFPLNGCEITVCKKYFLNTLSVSEQVVYTALDKIKKDISLTDKRGTHLNRPHKIRATTKETIKEHINLFPAIESHYIRKDSNRQYLSEQLNISKMYRLYRAWYAHQDHSTEYMGSKRQYETIFNTEYNYSFFKPKKDLCAICSLYEQADETKKASLEENYKSHLQRKNRVREIKQEEKAAIDPAHTTVAVFDLEKVLSVPQSEVGIFHYKRKYPIYNFTVFDTVKKSGYCYVWHLSVAKRGSIEIGSCLLQFIKHEALRGIKNISFYSDGCAGQNKNRFIFAMYIYALQTYGLESITHRFFETGHSQSEGDSMHSCVERAMKNKILFTPDQVYSVILNAKVTGEKYNLKEMEQADFYDIKSLVSEKNWVHDTQGSKISWSKIMEVKVTNERPHILECKYDFDTDYFQVDTQNSLKRARRSKCPEPTAAVAVGHLKKMYNKQIAISKPLHEDLISLCDSEAIPKYYHAFYKSLTSSETEDAPNPGDE